PQGAHLQPPVAAGPHALQDLPALWRGKRVPRPDGPGPRRLERGLSRACAHTAGGGRGGGEGGGMDGGERMMEPALAGAPASALPVLAVLREWGWAVEEVESPGPCPEDADAPPESAPPPREGVRGS
ncbi:hypothetical protein EG877_16785, partial [Enterococcus faecalis]